MQIILMAAKLETQEPTWITTVKFVNGNVHVEILNDIYMHKKMFVGNLNCYMNFQTVIKIIHIHNLLNYCSFHS